MARTYVILPSDPCGSNLATFLEKFIDEKKIQSGKVQGINMKTVYGVKTGPTYEFVRGLMYLISDCLESKQATRDVHGFVVSIYNPKREVVFNKPVYTIGLRSLNAKFKLVDFFEIVLDTRMPR